MTTDPPPAAGNDRTAVNRPTPAAVLQRLRQAAAAAAIPDGCDRTVILRYGAYVGSVIESHVSLSRAMDHARLLLAASARAGRSAASGTVILADTMERCKGRFSRSWHAPLGGVWGCMIEALTLLPQSRSIIPLAAGVACCEAVREIGGSRSLLRWVNDVLVDGRKLAGFLVEGYTEPVHGEEFALVGFGINVNNVGFPDELAKSATSLRQVLGRTIDISEFTTIFLARLAWNFGILHHEEARHLRDGGFSGKEGRHLLLDRWLDLSDIIGQHVVFGFDVVNDPQYRAEVLGLDAGGAIVLRLADGSVKTENCGEVRY